jgi:hypothetical protein
MESIWGLRTAERVERTGYSAEITPHGTAERLHLQSTLCSYCEVGSSDLRADRHAKCRKISTMRRRMSVDRRLLTRPGVPPIRLVMWPGRGQCLVSRQQVHSSMRLRETVKAVGGAERPIQYTLNRGCSTRTEAVCEMIRHQALQIQVAGHFLRPRERRL